MSVIIKTDNAKEDDGNKTIVAFIAIAVNIVIIFNFIINPFFKSIHIIYKIIICIILHMCTSYICLQCLDSAIK